MDEVDEYEEKVKKRVELNTKYLDKFDEWLANKGLSDKTIVNHLDNVDFYINTFLIYYDDCPMEKGCFNIDDYLGYWFIRKCMWASVSSIRSTASSIKKFYQCMSELGYVHEDAYKLLCQNIKDNMNKWLEAINKYRNRIY